MQSTGRVYGQRGFFDNVVMQQQKQVQGGRVIAADASMAAILENSAPPLPSSDYAAKAWQ